MILSIRPCPNDAFSPNDLNLVLGKKIQKDLIKGEHLKKEDFKK